MTPSPDLEALKALVAKWREQAKILETGVPDFSDGLAASRTECANDLEKALERLLAGQQEPVAWMTEDGRVCEPKSRAGMPETLQRTYSIPLFASPPVQEAGRLDLGNLRVIIETMTCTGKLPHGCPNCKGLDFCVKRHALKTLEKLEAL